MNLFLTRENSIWELPYILSTWEIRKGENVRKILRRDQFLFKLSPFSLKRKVKRKKKSFQLRNRETKINPSKIQFFRRSVIIDLGYLPRFKNSSSELYTHVKLKFEHYKYCLSSSTMTFLLYVGNEYIVTYEHCLYTSI